MTRLGTVSFSAACPYGKANQVSVSKSSIYFTADLMRGHAPYWDFSIIEDLKLISISVTGYVDSKDKIIGGINPKGHPVQAYFGVKPITDLGAVINAHAQLAYNQGGCTGYKQYAAPMINNYVQPPKGIYNPGATGGGSQINCGLPQNLKLCKALVMDDMNDNYNCAAWASGLTNHIMKPLATPLLNKANALKWYGDMGFEEIKCYNGNTLDPLATLVMYCDLNANNDCVPRDSDMYNHVAIKEAGIWTSKLGWLALIQHDPEDLPGYGQIALCFKGKRVSGQSREQVNSGYQFPQSHLDIVEQLINEASVNYQKRFYDLFIDWWYSIQETFPGGFPNNNTQSNEKKSREELISFIQKYPEVTPLLVKKLIKSKQWFEYRVFEAVTGQKCHEITKNYQFPGHECARNWILKQKPPKGTIHTISVEYKSN